MALRFILLAAFHLPLFTQSSLVVEEKLALDFLFDESGGMKWYERYGWKHPNIPICSWYGITCLGSSKDNHSVVDINLSLNNLVGRVSEFTYYLPHLKSLDVSANRGIIAGGFEGVRSAKVLQSLEFSSCSLTRLSGLQNAPSTLKVVYFPGMKLSGSFPTEILSLTKLEIVDLTFNEISGPIPSKIASLTNLEKALLSFNKISGGLPTEIGLLSNLKELYLFGNQLAGTVPTQIGLLTALQELQFGGNHLHGTLPLEINELSNLKVLGFNNQTGPTLNGPLPSFYGLTHLSYLNLDGNKFSGSVPSSFLSNQQLTNSLLIIGLKNNRLTGSLPVALTRFNKLDIALEGNLISGLPSQYCQKNQWIDGLVDHFGCNAILCPPGTFNEFGHQMSATTPCVPCSSSKYYGATTCDAFVRPTVKPAIPSPLRRPT